MSHKKLSCLVIGLAAVAIAGVARAALDSRSYIQDDLICQLDGIENSTRGGAHNNTATTWADISGSGCSVGVPSGAAFANGSGLATVRSGCRGNFSNWNPTLYNPFNSYSFTCEVAFDKPNATTKAPNWPNNDRCVFVGLGHDDYAIGTVGSNQFGFDTPDKNNTSSFGHLATCDSNVGRHTLSCRMDSSSWGIAVDGADPVIGACSKTKEAKKDHGFKFNSMAYWQNVGLDGTYHAIRMYRRALSDDEIKLNQAVDKVRFFGADIAEVAMPATYRFVVAAGDTNIEHKVSVVAEPSVGGTVAVNGGSASSADSFWIVKDSKVTTTLTASAAPGYRFAGWAGRDVAMSDQQSATITVSIGSDVYALFRKTDGSDAKTRTALASGDWHDNTNWKDANGIFGRPVAGDSVVIPSGHTMTLGQTPDDTAALASLTVCGTLSCSNWNTKVWADDITIASGGVVTVVGAFTGATHSNRVWLACRDLTIASGGQISMNAKGFSGGLSQQANGYGPGTVNVTGKYGCSHGGYGGNCSGSGNYPKLPYGSAEMPTEPGSGGRAGFTYGKDVNSCAGGGAVRIEASGRVTVNGSILASGKSSWGNEAGHSDLYDNPGSGGSIWITCATFAGTNAVIRAAGGNGSNPRAPTDLYGLDNRTTRSAGGGRIAIYYGPGQNAADVQNVEISTAAGLCTKYGETYSTMDLYHSGADCGTVWFSDTKLLDATLGKGLSGQIAFVTNYVYTGDLEWTKGHVRFAAPGATVALKGNLTMTNGNSRLEVGGCEYRIRTTFLEIYGGTNLNSLTVSGDIALLDGARLDIRSADMADTGDGLWGGLVTVGGNLHVASNSSVYAWCDPIRCTAPRFKVGSLTVDEGGLVSSKARGGAGGVNYGQNYPVEVRSNYGRSPMGTGNYHSAIYFHAGQHSQYGGKGTGYNSGWALPSRYDTGDGQYRPQYSGSGAGTGGYGDGGAGGGVVYVEGVGDIVVNGEINVDGDVPWFAASSYLEQEGGGSGGTIFLSGRTFSGGADARLTACGGAGANVGTDANPKFGGSGAGGCIAVWTGAEYPGKMTSRRITKSTSCETFLGTAVADGGGRAGGSLTVEVPDYAKGGNGTVWFCNVRDKGGVLLIVE